MNLSDSFGRVKNVSFQARRGEVLGFAGLVGSGRTETMRLIFGADRAKSGEIKLAEPAGSDQVTGGCDSSRNRVINGRP